MFLPCVFLGVLIISNDVYINDVFLNQFDVLYISLFVSFSALMKHCEQQLSLNKTRHI